MKGKKEKKKEGGSDKVMQGRQSECERRQEEKRREKDRGGSKINGGRIERKSKGEKGEREWIENLEEGGME